jgi:hypothetical protein
MTRYTKTFAEAMKEVRTPKVVKEDYEVSMAIGQLKTINEYATKLIPLLEAKGSDYNIEAWVQSKITTAEDYMNTVGHYMENNPDVANEESELKEKDGANTSTKKGSVWKAAMKAKMKKNYMRKAENDPSIKEADDKGEKDIDKIALAKEKDTDAIEKQLQAALSNLALTKQKLENEKNKVVKPQPNKQTGEVPLRTGLANAILDKKINTKSIVQAKKKEEIKVGGKTKIEINPHADIGNFSGGMRVDTGNLH